MDDSSKPISNKIFDSSIHSSQARGDNNHVEKLSDSQLLSVILSASESKTKPIAMRAIGLHIINENSHSQKARNLLVRMGSMRAIFKASYHHLVHKYGLNDSEALSIISVNELINRIATENVITQVKYNSAEKCMDYFQSMLRDCQQERFSCLFLSNQFHYLGYRELFVGNTHSAPVYFGEVVRAAIDYNAVNVIVGHNHPSGDPSPSDTDVRMTKKLKQSLDLIDVSLIDHIIIGRNDNVSLAQLGVI